MKSPQIDLNKIKDLLKKLSFLKNNMALLVPIIIAVVAALFFIPTKLLSARLQRTIADQSLKQATEIDRLIKDVKEAGQMQAMEAYVNAYAQDANSIEAMMTQSTMRELFAYDIFPDPCEVSPLLFESVHRGYLSGVESMIQRLGAGDPPTDAEIDAALEKSPMRSMYGRNRAGGGGAYGGAGGAYGGAGGAGRSYRMLTDTDKKILDKLCEDKARTLRLYANPADLDGYLFWTDWKFENREKALRQCWYWQMGYWILEDVVDTVEAMNKSGSCVLDSSVKRVLGVGFTLSKQGNRMIGGRRGRAVRRDGAQMPTPGYVINAKTAMAATPCTGRYCSADADVMHFEVRVLINADQVMPFIQELCSAKTHKFRGWYGKDPEQTFKHNQITVLEHSIIPIDLEDSMHAVYRYGADAVVELDLICEYLFPKSVEAEAGADSQTGTDSASPTIVKDYESAKPQVVKDDIAGVNPDSAK
ncbi:MAG: hypothetical protein ACM3VT_03750 [Solirubrobacterales bacterium]